MSATIDPLLIPRTKQTQAHIELEHENGRAPDPCGRIYFWRRNLRYTDFTAAAATSQNIDLFADLTAAALARAGQSGDFPANAWVNVLPPYIRRITPWAGGSISAFTLEVGYSGDRDGFVTATNCFTGTSAGIVNTPAAALYAADDYAALAPSATARSTTADLTALTAGESEIVIPYTFILRDI